MSDAHMDAKPAAPSLRHAMDYLHTWVGLVFSMLLFLVFFMGTLSVFDREIDRWMMPDTRISTPASFSYDADVMPQIANIAPGAKFLFLSPPGERQPMASVGWRDGTKFKRRYIDVSTGKVLAADQSWGGTGFFFPFHYSFHIKWKDVGYWLLAIVSVGMMAVLVAGVIIHKKIFTDLFTFRPEKSGHRVTLDLHNVTGVLLLPFHFLIVLSGLIVFLFIYFQPAVPLLYGNETGKASKEAFGTVTRLAAKEPGELGSIDSMVSIAQERWGGGNVRNVGISNPGDKNAVVNVSRSPDDQVGYETMTIYFDRSGEVISQQRLVPAGKIQRFFSGMHMIPFSHWGLRWMYFFMGLAGCVMIASGMLLWVDKRKVRHVKEGRRSYRLVDALACTASAGVVLSTFAMLIANRTLPLDIPSRPATEAGVYFGVWILSLLYCLWRMRGPFTRVAWRDHAWAIAATALLSVILNAVTTGDHLFATIGRGDWAVAGMDAMLLLAAAIAVLTARKLQRRLVSDAQQPAPKGAGGRAKPAEATP